MSEPMEPLSIRPGNSRIRVVAVHEVFDSHEMQCHLDTLVTNQRIACRFEREFTRANMRQSGSEHIVGRHWLTNQAYSLIDQTASSGGTETKPVREYRLLPAEINLLFPGIWRFQPRNKTRCNEECVQCQHHADRGCPLSVRDAGVVISTFGVCLCWVDISLRCSDPSRWRKLANAFDYRTPPGEHLEFTRHFQTDNLSMVGAGEFVHRVEGIIFPRGAPRQASSKSLLRFSRYHVIGGNSGTALDFLNSAASARHRCKVEGSVDCPDAWTIAIGVDSLTLMLHTPAHCAVGNRFPAFSNSFNLADLWLSFVISVVRREGYRQVDNQTRKIAASLDSVSSAEIQSKVTEICSNFEAVTLRHSRLRLQANIGEIHSDPRRSSIYFALRQTWTDIHTDKMLDDLLSELQHRIIELRPRKSSRKTKSSVKSVRDSTVFISYRRSDSQDVVGRMYDRLARKFGRMRVVRDLDHLEPGKPFDIALDAAIASSSMALIIIGPTWLTTEEVSGKRRLDNPTDFVRREVECALGRDIPVVPVLVTHATMPMSADLPESIRDLVSRHGLKVRPDPDFRTDMNQLIKVVGNVLNG